MSRTWRGQRLRWLGWGLSLAAVVAALYLARRPLLTGACRGLDVGVAPKPADVVLVLPGGEETRPFVAAALVKQGYAQQVVFPKNIASPKVQDGLAPPTHEVIRRALITQGVDESKLQFLESASSSTWEDAEAFASYLRSRPGITGLIVTHHYHTRRSRWVFRRVLGAAADRVAFVSAPTDEFDCTTWWRTKDGLHAVLSEYLKFTYYLFRYGDWRAWSFVAGVVGLVLLQMFRGRKSAYLRGLSDETKAGPRRGVLRIASVFCV